MAGRFIRGSHLRSLLPAVLLLAPALAVATILVGAFTGAERPNGADGAATAEAATHGDKSGGRGAKTITIGWVGDITPGSQYGLPANGGASLFANVGDTLRAPDLMAGNLEGTLSTGGASKCGAGAANCFAFQAPPANGRALGAAGLEAVALLLHLDLGVLRLLHFVEDAAGVGDGDADAGALRVGKGGRQRQAAQQRQRDQGLEVHRVNPPYVRLPAPWRRRRRRPPRAPRARARQRPRTATHARRRPQVAAARGYRRYRPIA